MILVSACLWGQAVRYDGRARPHAGLLSTLKEEEVIALCPEIMGGLTVPRPPARFSGARPGQEGYDLLQGRARLLNALGQDVSQAFISGAARVLELAGKKNVRLAYLKDRSPSCAFDPQGLNPLPGPRLGVLSALLLLNGIAVREVRN
jgi:uncharacterized protein YbbK (DUF523 family)